MAAWCERPPLPTHVTTFRPTGPLSARCVRFQNAATVHIRCPPPLLADLVAARGTLNQAWQVGVVLLIELRQRGVVLLGLGMRFLVTVDTAARCVLVGAVAEGFEIAARTGAVDVVCILCNWRRARPSPLPVCAGWGRARRLWRQQDFGNITCHAFWTFNRHSAEIVESCTAVNARTFGSEVRVVHRPSSSSYRHLRRFSREWSMPM